MASNHLHVIKHVSHHRIPSIGYCLERSKHNTVSIRPKDGMTIIDLANYESSPEDSTVERQGIFGAQIQMLQWLTRGHIVDNVTPTARARAYYNRWMHVIIARELMPYAQDPQFFHIMYARNLILDLKCRYVPGDERGMILRSDVCPNTTGSTRRKRGKHRSRSQGNAQSPLEPVREADLSLEQTALRNMPMVMVRNIPPKMSSPGKADVLNQCAHGPCQRYIPVHMNKAWCYQCERIEIHASFLIYEDERKRARCPSCLREGDDVGYRVTTQ